MLLVIKPNVLDFVSITPITSSQFRDSKVWKGKSASHRKNIKRSAYSLVMSAIGVLALGDCAFCVNCGGYSRVI